MFSGETAMAKKLKRVILVTGTPCVGKTSVARILSKKISALHVNLAELVREEKLFMGVDETRGTLIADVERLSVRVGKIIQSADRDLLIDGHFAMHVVPPKKVHKAFVLRRNPEELRVMMEERGYVGRKLWENLAAEILDVCLTDAISTCGLRKVCEVDATGRRPDEVAEEVASILGRRKPCRVGVVDWLGKLEAEGRLDEFLRNF